MTKIKNAEELGAIIRKVRKAQGLRQEDLALAAGAGIMSISRLERGTSHVRIDLVLRVLDVLGLDFKIASASDEADGWSDV
ncbi:MAG: helix-turn-helix transcriptional regulator [Solirubrobacterales bacterium]|nr:helix-turn-helix transcriptional regulator [Solirubrobacterales bacterium]